MAGNRHARQGVEAPECGPHLGTLRSRWTRVNGLLLHARVSIEPTPAGRPAVVLIHGLNISSRNMIPPARRLAPYCPVYAPDLPGFGESERPDHTLTIAELAEVLADWMEAVGLRSAVLIANSFGCQVAVECARRYPARVERLVLIGPTMDPAARPLLRALRRWLQDGGRETLSLRLSLLRDYAWLNLVRAIRTLFFMLQDRIEEKLPQVQAPTLVVRGSRDPIVSQGWAEEVTHLLPDGRLVVIPGAPHALHFSAPLEFIRVVRPFLCLDEPISKERLGA